MTFDSLLIHRLVCVYTPTSDATEDLDEAGQPTADGDPVVTPFRGRVYARSEREIAESVQAGAGISTHIIRARPTFEPYGVDYIAHADPEDFDIVDVNDPRRYHVTAVHRRADGTGVHHLAIEAKLVSATPGVVADVAAS